MCALCYYIYLRSNSVYLYWTAPSTESRAAM